MRLRQEEIEYTAWKIVQKLKGGGDVELHGKEEEAVEHIRRAIIDDLRVEDDLNREVDEIIRDHQNEIQREPVDYRRMFRLIKNRLAKERNIIL